jgi:hypothetical protein
MLRVSNYLPQLPLRRLSICPKEAAARVYGIRLWHVRRRYAVNSLETDLLTAPLVTPAVDEEPIGKPFGGAAQSVFSSAWVR